MTVLAMGLLVAACSSASGPSSSPAAVVPSQGPSGSPVTLGSAASPAAVAAVGSVASPAAVVSVAPAASPLPDPGAATGLLIARAIDAVKADPTNQESLLELGLAYYQHARETADATDYARADEAFDRILAIDPANADALVGKGTLALAKHQFAAALTFGQQAQTVEPKAARVYGVIGDALTELGRYPDAIDAVQTMVNTRPDLSSYSRVSYQRELHGDLEGATSMMEQAVIAGGPATENTEYLRVILGNLWFTRGDLDKAAASYAASLDHSPGYVFALAGQARVAAAKGDLRTAIALYQQAEARVPFPEFLIAQGEAQEAAGLADDAAGTYRLVRQIEGYFAANGVNTDLDLALFESDHGDPATALRLARAAYAETPNIKAADALAWALFHNGQLVEARQRAEEALRLGTLDPSYLYHAGMVAAAQSDDAAARSWLGQSLARNPMWSPLHAPRAAAALAELGSGPVATAPSPVSPAPAASMAAAASVVP